MYEAQSTPLSIAGVLDQGFKAVKASFGRVVGLSIFGAYAANLPGALMQGLLDPQNASGAALTAVFVIALIGGLISLAVFGAIVFQIDAIMKNNTVPIFASLGAATRRLIVLVLCGIFYGLVVGVGTVLLVVPGVILSVSMMFCFYLVFTDGLGPIEALKQSHRLVWGNWWRTVAVVSVGIIITIAAYMLPLFAIGFLSVAVGQGGPIWMIEAFAVPLITGIVSPVGYAFFMAQLQDLKLRKTGDDLEDRLDAMESQ